MLAEVQREGKPADLAALAEDRQQQILQIDVGGLEIEASSIRQRVSSIRTISTQVRRSVNRFGFDARSARISTSDRTWTGGAEFFSFRMWIRSRRKPCSLSQEQNELKTQADVATGRRAAVLTHPYDPRFEVSLREVVHPPVIVPGHLTTVRLEAEKHAKDCLYRLAVFGLQPLR